MRRSRIIRGNFVLALVPSLFIALSPVRAADPFLEFDFETPEDLDAFFNPGGVDFTSCPGGFPVIPSGFADVSLDGDVEMRNSAIFGINLLLTKPATVQEFFPESRDYKARVKFKFETASQLGISLRLRGGIDETLGQADSQFERGYTVSVFPEGAGDNFPGGAISVVELSACHGPIDHDDWPNADVAGGFALVDSGATIARESWYWAEVAAAGSEDGGPVTISARVWPDGEARPLLPIITVTDPDGLELDAETRASERDLQFGLGVSLDYPDPSQATREPGATMRVDDIALTALEGCRDPPVLVERELWEPRTSVRGDVVALYGDGRAYTVRLRIRPRDEDPCARPARIHVRETPPAGWIASNVTGGGMPAGEAIEWDVPIENDDEIVLEYDLNASGSGPVEFTGAFLEPPGDFVHEIDGERLADSESPTAPLSDFMSIQHWLVLGPFVRAGGGAPGETEIARDYLTDGVASESELRPEAGDSIDTDFGGAAASTGLAPDTLGRNAGGVPTWVEWHDIDDGEDRIDFEEVYGEQDDVMCYAVTYLSVTAPTTVHFGVSSNDSIQLLLDGESIHVANVARNAEARFYQDTPTTHPGLGGIELATGAHVLMAKIFEGTGPHNFRVGFMSADGNLLLAPPAGVTVTSSPDGGPHVDTFFVRGDSNNDGIINLTDGVFVLNYLFTGGDTPTCQDAADTNGDNAINITDGTFVLNFLFIGGPPPPQPHPDCGADPDDDTLPECGFAGCG